MDAMLNEQEKYNLEVEDTIAKIKMHSSENSLVIPIFLAHLSVYNPN